MGAVLYIHMARYRYLAKRTSGYSMVVPRGRWAKGAERSGNSLTVLLNYPINQPLWKGIPFMKLLRFLRNVAFGLTLSSAAIAAESPSLDESIVAAEEVRVKDAWGADSALPRTFLSRPAGMKDVEWDRYRSGERGLPLRFLPNRERHALNMTFGGGAAMWLTTPVGVVLLVTSVGQDDLGTVVGSTLTAAGLGAIIATPIAHMKSAQRLRSLGYRAPTGNAIASFVVSGVVLAASIPNFGNLGTIFILPAVMAAGAVAHTILWALQHRQLRRGWTLAVERNPSLLRETRSKPRVTVVPHIDLIGRQLGIAGVW